MGSQSHASAIISTNQTNILDVIRQELKAMQFREVLALTDPGECIRTLEDHEDAVLILDWAIGENECGKILESVQASHRIGVRPIFLFSRGEVKGIEGVALEYGVAQLHIGEMSRDIIAERINRLISSALLDKNVRDGFNAVADARERGDYAAVRKILEDLYEKFPEEPVVAAELAEDYFRTEEFEDCMGVVGPFITSDQKNPRLLNLYGRSCMKKGDYEAASIHLQQADLINPYNVKRLLRLGNAYLQIDNASRAKKTFSRALKIDGNSKDAKSGMGQSLLLGGEINEALVFLRQLTDDAEMASVFNIAAIISIRNGRYKDGMNLYRVACKTIGQNNKKILAKLAVNMGLANYKSKNLKQAQYYFVLSEKLDSGYEKAKHLVSTITKLIGKADNLQVDSPQQLWDALLKNDWPEKDELAGEDMKIGKSSFSKAIDYDMEF